jgi:colicin import membrane protein
VEHVRETGMKDLILRRLGGKQHFYLSCPRHVSQYVCRLSPREGTNRGVFENGHYVAGSPSVGCAGVHNAGDMIDRYPWAAGLVGVPLAVIGFVGVVTRPSLFVPLLVLVGVALVVVEYFALQWEEHQARAVAGTRKWNRRSHSDSARMQGTPNLTQLELEAHARAEATEAGALATETRARAEATEAQAVVAAAEALAAEAGALAAEARAQAKAAEAQALTAEPEALAAEAQAQAKAAEAQARAAEARAWSRARTEATETEARAAEARKHAEAVEAQARAAEVSAQAEAAEAEARAAEARARATQLQLEAKAKARRFPHAY